jgi:hypothetical protein
MENWKKVFYNGRETNIEVTKCGRVRKVEKIWYGNHTSKYGEVDFTKLKLHPNGYKHITIQIFCQHQKTVKVHQLIAAAFLGYQFNGNKLVVDHIDSNKLNNHLDNLRIIENIENTLKERVKKSGLPLGVFKVNNKYKAQKCINGKLLYLGLFNTIEEASIAYEKKLL